jgi:hypothetical protein
MKFKFYALAILLSCTVMLLSSCEQEALITESLTQDDPRAFLAASAPAILFQYEVKNELTSENQGWIIDREGNLRTYVNAGFAISSANTETELDRLLDNSTIVDQIDINDLAIRYGHNRVLSDQPMRIEDPNPNADVKVSYYAFFNKGPNAEYDQCGDKEENVKDGPEVFQERFILETNIPSHMIIDHINGEETLQWLKALGDGLN